MWPSPESWDSPALWSTVAVFVRTGSVTKRFLWWTWQEPTPAPGVPLPWHSSFRGAAGTHDLGLMIADNPTLGLGSPGWEVLGLRAPWPWEVPILEQRSGGGFDAERGDLVFGQLARRDPSTVGRYVGRGMGLTPKRWGVLTPDMAAGRARMTDVTLVTT